MGRGNHPLAVAGAWSAGLLAVRMTSIAPARRRAIVAAGHALCSPGHAMPCSVLARRACVPHRRQTWCGLPALCTAAGRWKRIAFTNRRGGGGGSGAAGGPLPSCSGSAWAGLAFVAHLTHCSSMARCCLSACSVPGWASPLAVTLGTGQVALAALVRCAASSCLPHLVQPHPLAVRTTS